MTATIVAKVYPVHLRRSLALHAFGRFDPTATWSIEGTESFSKAFSRGSGVCNVTLRTVEGGVEILADGEEAGLVVKELCLSLETQDGYESFDPDNAVISRLQRELPGLRLFRVPWLLDIACSVILQQRVKSTDAMRDWKNIAIRFGTKTPNGLVAFPNANTLSAVPLHSLQAMGIDPRRARTLISCAKEIKLHPFRSSLSLEHLRSRLSRIPGIGPWTVDMILGFGAGDCDAVPIGDLYLPHLVAFALAGEPRGTDERMVELLEPFRPNRFRVVRLLYAAKFKVPGW